MENENLPCGQGTQPDLSNYKNLFPEDCHPSAALHSRAQSIGLRPTVAYVAADSSQREFSHAHQSLNSDEKRKVKDRLRQAKKRSVSVADGFVQFNRNVSHLNVENLSALVERLKHSADWNEAVLADPAVEDLQRKICDLQRLATFLAARIAELESEKNFTVALATPQEQKGTLLRPVAFLASQLKKIFSKK
jgi:hypothetical protein